MKSLLLIENQTRDLWRLVQRECTSCGMSSTKFIVVGENYPRYDYARFDFDVLKGKKNGVPRYNGPRPSPAG